MSGDDLKKKNKFLIVLGASHQTTNLSKALEGNVTEGGNIKETLTKGVDDISLKNVAQRDPIEETKKGFQGRADQRGLFCLGEDLEAETEDLGEFIAHTNLEVLCLFLGHLFGGKVKDLFGEELQNDHVILAQSHIGPTNRDDLGDKVWPIMGPFLLEDLSRRNKSERGRGIRVSEEKGEREREVTYLNKDHVELINKSTFTMKNFFVFRVLDDSGDNVVFDAGSGIGGHGLPPSLDEFFEDLQSDEARLQNLGVLENGVSPFPGIRMFLKLSEDLLGPLLLHVR